MILIPWAVNGIAMTLMLPACGKLMDEGEHNLKEHTRLWSMNPDHAAWRFVNPRREDQTM